VFLAESWAEPVEDDGSAAVQPPVLQGLPTCPLVLVVDDDPDLRVIAQSFLTASGYRVALAENGREALRHVRTQCPDLILLDLRMPVMDGWQFRRRQRRLRDRDLASVPVLLITGSPDAAQHAKRLRAVGVVQKPVEPHDLVHAVEAAIA
jgi:CheY-like chemotaxis protein